MTQDMQSIWIEALQQADIPELERLAAGQPELIQQPSAAGISPLMTAIYHRQPQVVVWLLEHGAVAGPYEAAAIGDHASLAADLQQQPALLSAHAADGFTLLTLASFFGQPDCLLLLLKAGADPNLAAANAARGAPLHAACAGADQQQRLAAARLLLEHGAQANARQQRGFTPLHAAADSGDLDLIRLLLEHGADPGLADDDGQSPLDYARARGNHAAARLLA